MCCAVLCCAVLFFTILVVTGHNIRMRMCISYLVLFPLQCRIARFWNNSVCNSTFSSAPRILQLGIELIELHSYLMTHHSCAVLVLLEDSATLANIALLDLGYGNSFCKTSVEQYNRDNAFMLESESQVDELGESGGSGYVSSVNPYCRSRIIVDSTLDTVGAFLFAINNKIGGRCVYDTKCVYVTDCVCIHICRHLSEQIQKSRRNIQGEIEDSKFF